MNRSERCHALAVELHSWIEYADFKTDPEPSIQEIEECIRDFMGMDKSAIKENESSNPR